MALSNKHSENLWRLTTKISQTNNNMSWYIFFKDIIHWPNISILNKKIKIKNTYLRYLEWQE